jgi:hypothetical protein
VLSVVVGFEVMPTTQDSENKVDQQDDDFDPLSYVDGELEDIQTSQDSENAGNQQQLQPMDDTMSQSTKAATIPKGIRRLENDFTFDQLNDAFDPLLGVDWELVPNAFLPVDHESMDWEFAELIFPEIIAAILNGSALMRVDDLAKTFIRNWDFIAAAYKKQLLDRIRYVIRLASQKRFSPYITFGEKGSSNNEIKSKTPEKLNEAPATIRTQLQRRFRELMEDLNSPQIAMIYQD